MNKNLYSLLFCLGLAAAPATLLAQPGKAQSYKLLFQTGAAEPVANSHLFRMMPVPAPTQTADGYYFRIIQFWQIPTEEQKEQIKNLGVQLHQYMPYNAYFASLPENLNRDALTRLGVRAVLEIEPARKLSKSLLSRDYPAWAVQNNTHIDLVVQYFPSVEPARAENMLTARQFQILGRNNYSRQLTIRVPVSEIETVAQLPFILYLEPVDAPAEPENLVGRTSHRSNSIATDYAMGRKYTGQGVKVAMGDDGIIGPHIDYQGRADQSEVSVNDGDHGDHVAGIIMGAGNRDPKTRGMAYGADLHVYQVWNAINSTPTSYLDGIRITSTSYSNGCNAGYTGFARTADQQCREMPSLIHVFSAGNSGTTNCGYGAGSNWGNITGGVKVGKNVLTVANLSYTDGVSSSSSRGPAHDGRIKPDISAVGSSVYSTVDVNSYATKSGTSMSCPGVSGTLAQLYQAHRELNNGADPNAGFLKAVVLNTADDLGNSGPDFIYGYGRINALRAVRVLENQTYFSGTATQGSAATHQITVPAGTKQVKVMVYWTDYEASSNAATALVNDLNMQLTTPGGTSYNPWVLNPAPSASSLSSPATRGVDNLNNMEQVTLNDPAAGTYTVSVAGTAVPVGPQPYYVVYTFLNSAPELTYPIGGETFVPGEQETIRWDAYGNTGTFQLAYSADSGSTWNTISGTVPADRRYYNWTVPAQVTGRALVKLTRGAETDTSNAVFTIVRVPSGLTFEYICPDSASLKWTAVSGASGYEISRLGQKYMDSIATTTATSIVLYGLGTAQEDWFSVKALTSDNGKGRRAIAVKKPTGVSNCVSPDVAITAITNPVSGCYNQLNNQICITIKNNGPSAVSNFDVSLSVDTAMPVILTVPVTILSGGSANYCFTNAGLLNVSASGPVQITASVMTPNDANQANNTQTVTPVLLLPPVASFSHSGSGNQYSFSASQITGATYSWNFGDGNFSSQASPVHSYTGNSNYTVTLTVTGSNGCSSSVSDTLAITSGVAANLHQQIKIYPNPASGDVQLEWPGATDGKLQLEIVNMLGMVLHRETAANNSHRLSLQHLPEGTYVVKLIGNSQSYIAPLILQW